MWFRPRRFWIATSARRGRRTWSRPRPRPVAKAATWGKRCINSGGCHGRLTKCLRIRRSDRFRARYFQCRTHWQKPVNARWCHSCWSRFRPLWAKIIKESSPRADTNHWHRDAYAHQTECLEPLSNGLRDFGEYRRTISPTCPNSRCSRTLRKPKSGVIIQEVGNGAENGDVISPPNGNQRGRFYTVKHRVGTIFLFRPIPTFHALSPTVRLCRVPSPMADSGPSSLAAAHVGPCCATVPYEIPAQIRENLGKSEGQSGRTSEPNATARKTEFDASFGSGAKALWQLGRSRNNNPPELADSGGRGEEYAFSGDGLRSQTRYFATENISGKITAVQILTFRSIICGTLPQAKQLLPGPSLLFSHMVFGP